MTEYSQESRITRHRVQFVVRGIIQLYCSRMELVSGKMPTNASFSLDIDMVKWVKIHIEMQGLAWEELIDLALSLLLAREENAASQVLEIVLQYTKTAPQVSPSSRRACDLLFHVFNNRMMDNLVCTS